MDFNNAYTAAVLLAVSVFVLLRLRKEIRNEKPAKAILKTVLVIGGLVFFGLLFFAPPSVQQPLQNIFAGLLVLSILAIDVFAVLLFISWMREWQSGSPLFPSIEPTFHVGCSCIVLALFGVSLTVAAWPSILRAIGWVASLLR